MVTVENLAQFWVSRADREWLWDLLLMYISEQAQTTSSEVACLLLLCRICIKRLGRPVFQHGKTMRANREKNPLQAHLASRPVLGVAIALPRTCPARESIGLRCCELQEIKNQTRGISCVVLLLVFLRITLLSSLPYLDDTSYASYREKVFLGDCVVAYADLDANVEQVDAAGALADDGAAAVTAGGISSAAAFGITGRNLGGWCRAAH